MLRYALSACWIALYFAVAGSSLGGMIYVLSGIPGDVAGGRFHARDALLLLPVLPMTCIVAMITAGVPSAFAGLVYVLLFLRSTGIRGTALARLATGAILGSMIGGLLAFGYGNGVRFVLAGFMAGAWCGIAIRIPRSQAPR